MSTITDVATVMAFQYWFGLEPGSSRVLLALYQWRVGSLSGADLSRGTGYTVHSMRRHHIPQIREAMEQRDAEAVDFDGGYKLTITGRAQCLEAIRQMGLELTGVADQGDGASFLLTDPEPAI